MKNPEFQKIFTPFPFGSDFTAEEEHLALALQLLERDQKSKLRLLRRILSPASSENFDAELKRMDLQGSLGWKDRIFRHLLRSALAETQRQPT